jgi:hypothetical protein
VGRLTALWPLATAGLAVLLAFGAWRATGLFLSERTAVEYEFKHLLIGESWLPGLGFGVAAYTGWRLVRGRSAPISGVWAFDLALVAAAAALGARAYDAFTAEVSYAPYYAAPLVLLLGVLHERVAARWPGARRPVILALGAVAAGLATYSLVALYPDQDTPVHTARGTVVMDAAAARAFQPTIDYVERHAAPGEPIVSLPSDAGLYFMTGHRPALYNVMFFPGLLDSKADERDAIAHLKRDGVRLAVVGDRKFVGYGYTRFGVDYNRVLASFIHSHGGPVATFGDPKAPIPGGSNPTRVYRVYQLR